MSTIDSIIPALNKLKLHDQLEEIKQGSQSLLDPKQDVSTMYGFAIFYLANQVEHYANKYYEKRYLTEDWKRIKLDCNILLQCCIVYKTGTIYREKGFMDEITHNFGGNVFNTNSVLLLVDSLYNRDIQVPPRLIIFQQALEFAIKRCEDVLIKQYNVEGKRIRRVTDVVTDDELD